MLCALARKKYRVLDEHGKEAVDSSLNIEHARILLLEQERENKKNTQNLKASNAFTEPQNKAIKVYCQSAAAGLGNYLDSDDYDIITFPEDKILPHADFGIRISGDSMMPKIADGNIVWVEAMPQIEDGEIGVFILDGDALCRQLHIDYDNGKVELISFNPKYKPRIILESEDLRTIGKVLLMKH